MFCDLVGSTALSEQLDPEDLREMILSYREVCAEEIRRNGKQIAQSFGDGLMVYFGYPSGRDWQATQKSALAGIAITSRQGFTYLLSWGTMLNGWALVQSGQVESGIVQMRQGLDIYSTTGSEINRPFFLSLLAEAYLQVEQVDAGLAILSEALQIVEATGEHL